MKLNIYKLLYADVDFPEVDEKYLNKVTTKKILYNSYDYDYYNYNVYYLNDNIFTAKANKLIGRNVSELYHSLKSDGKMYIRSLKVMIRDYVDITNVNGKRVDRYGGIASRLNKFYIDENNILCKYNKKKVKQANRQVITELDYIAKIFNKAESLMEMKKTSILQANDRITNGALNRLLLQEKLNVQAIVDEYHKVYNYLYNRVEQDKSDRKIKINKVNKRITKLSCKSRTKKQKRIVFAERDNLIRKSMFTVLTGLR